MQLKFLGAAGTVTGSSYVLTSSTGESLMIDLGMFQGPPEIANLNFAALDFDCSQLLGVVLTHAHLDHCGRLPLLLKHRFQGPIFMTAPTYDLSQLALYDTAKIARQDKTAALYNDKEVDQIIKLFKTVKYHESFQLGSFQITYYDAGHILGSASIEIVDTKATGDIQKIIFSGDIGNYPEMLVQSTELFAAADLVVMESTYGDRLHPDQNPLLILQSEVNAVEGSGGTLLIPAFSLERTQELLYMFKQLKDQAKIKKDTPIFLDSPMAESATDIYREYTHLFNAEIQSEFLKGDPFDFPNLFVSRKYADSQAAAGIPGAKVILAGSGMMTGGRIVDHAAHYLPMASTRLLIVGFQGEDTLGRDILEGKNPVTINGSVVPIHATVVSNQAMSSHADQLQLLQWLVPVSNVKHIILTHGEDTARAVLKTKIAETRPDTTIHTPHQNEVISL